MTNNGGCDGGCTNTIGSFVCDCEGRTGFELGQDGHSCVGKSTQFYYAYILLCIFHVFYCLELITVPDCRVPENTIKLCKLTVSRFISETFLSISYPSCADIDECVTGTHNCNERANCTNTNGSFTCQCKEGYTGDGIECEGMIYTQ